MQVRYKDKTYEGDVEEIIKYLRVEQRLSYRDIQKLVSRSYTYIGNVLKKANLNQPIQYPELKDSAFFENQSDEQIASDLNISVSKVASARKNLGLRKKNIVKVKSRQRSLVKFLFGKEWRPGPEFIDYIKIHLTQMAPKKAELIDRFYLQGQMEALSDNINSDTNRVYRSKARKELKEIIKASIPSLVELGVLNGKNLS